MKWEFNQKASINEIKKLSQEYNINELLTKLILNRINDIEFLSELFNKEKAITSPYRLHNAKAVAERIKYNIDNGNDIFIHADYDADGINSGFIIGDVIKAIVFSLKSKSNVEVYYPERTHGYGLSMWYVQRMLNIKNSSDKNILVITVDNGIAQVKEINTLVDNGIEVLVTDHHPNKKIVPNCLICDPKNSLIDQEDLSYLCGTAVAYKVCSILQDLYGFNIMNRYLPNVAIATIADVMPLTSENMALIMEGFNILNSNMCPNNFKALKDTLNIDVIDSMCAGWSIGPMINSCSRLGQTQLAGSFIEAKTIEQGMNYAIKLKDINETRKKMTKEIEKNLSSQSFDDSLVSIYVLSNEYPHGLCGIIAGKLLEKYQKPAIVVSDIGNGILNGSARALYGTKLLKIFEIELSNKNIIDYGGHNEACGITFSKDKIENIKASINSYGTKYIPIEIVEDENLIKEEVIYIDNLITINNINADTFKLINQIPYDSNFKRPIFLIKDCIVIGTPKISKNKEDNMWLTVKQANSNKTVKLWCQGLARLYYNLIMPDKINVVGYIENNFMYPRSGAQYHFKVLDIKRAE